MRDWIQASANPDHPRVLAPLRLFAVLGTWMEADVVAATIRNAVTQGCERIYLVDNGSSDDTVRIARAEGAVLARSFKTERYSESLRLRHMNDVVAEVSDAEATRSLWWLFLDADEFPHGPRGLTLRQYLATLDLRFRVVGMRFIDHYPSASPANVEGRHPLDYQPLAEELAYPMCPSGHRKHSLQRFDRGAPPIECGPGFHVAKCEEPLYEPAQPAFLHHFPYRDRQLTQRRLEALWTKNRDGVLRATEALDTHMLARVRSLDAVYAGDWASVHNFIALDPMAKTLEAPPPATGVHPRPWTEIVGPDHVRVQRWYSLQGVWNYGTLPRFNYGDDTTYRQGMAFLDGHGDIEDWGCGFAHARTFVSTSRYRGVDGSGSAADVIADLTTYRTTVDCIFMRHVLEHNFEWRQILANAVASFQRRMVVVIFTPFAATTHRIVSATEVTAVPVPDIAFRKADLTRCFAGCRYREESCRTRTQYGTEHVFYLEK
jgi:hypothetical protein